MTISSKPEIRTLLLLSCISLEKYVFIGYCWDSLKNYTWLFVYSYELHKSDFNFVQIQNIKILLQACRNLKQSTSTQGMRMILCLLPCYTKFRKRSIICPSYHILYWKDTFFCYIFVCMQGYRGWYTYDQFNNRF